MAGGDSRGVEKVVRSVTLGAVDTLLLTVDLPQGLRYESYRVSLQPQAGPEVWHTVLPAAATENSIPLRIPAHMLGDGEYRLLVRGVASGDGSAGNTSDPVADYLFAVRDSMSDTNNRRTTAGRKGDARCRQQIGCFTSMATLTPSEES